MIVRELVTRLGFSVDDKGLRQYEASVDNVKNSVVNASNAMKAAIGAVSAVAVTGLIKGLADVSDRLNTLQSRLSGLSQASNFGELAKEASRVGAGMEDYVDSYIRLAAASDGALKTQSEVVDLLNTLQAGLKASGADAGSAAGVMRQFGQALGSGTLRGDEFNSMAEGAGVLMRELSRAILGPTGTIGAMREMAAKGKLTTDVILKGMKAIGPAMQAQALSAPRTMGQALQNLKDQATLMAWEFDRAAGITQTLVRAVDWLAQSARSAVEWFGGMEHISATLGVTLGTIATVYAPVLIKAITATTAALFRMLAPLAPFIAGFAAIYLVVDDLMHWIKGQPSIAGQLFGDFAQYADKIKALIDDIKQRLQGLWGAWKDFGGAVVKAVKGDVSGAAQGVGSAFGKASDATGITALYNGAVDTLSRGFDRVFGGSSGGNVNITNTVTIQGNASPAVIQGVQDAVSAGNERGAFLARGR